MRLKEITKENSTYLTLRGRNKLSVGSLYFTMLNMYDAIETGALPKSTWHGNFEKFNAAINEALDILNKCPDQKDSFVLNLKSVLNSYQTEIKNLNEQI